MAMMYSDLRDLRRAARAVPDRDEPRTRLCRRRARRGRFDSPDHLDPVQPLLGRTLPLSRPMAAPCAVLGAQIARSLTCGGGFPWIPRASQAIQLGVPLDERSSIYFFLCLGAAIFIVLLYAMKKFEESSIDAKEDAFFAQLLPRYLATREEYSKALVLYIGTLILTVVIFSLLGPLSRQPGKAPKPRHWEMSLPLFIALVLVGVLPTVVPVLQGIEPRLRRFFHERAFIPAAARATAEKMAAADFDSGLYSDPDSPRYCRCGAWNAATSNARAVLSNIPGRG